MKTKSMKTYAAKTKAMKAKAPISKAKKAKAVKAKAVKRRAAVRMPRPAAVIQTQPWDKLKMTQDEYMFWVTRGVDPSIVEPGAPIVSAGFNV